MEELKKELIEFVTINSGDIAYAYGAGLQYTSDAEDVDGLRLFFVELINEADRIEEVAYEDAPCVSYDARGVHSEGHTYYAICKAQHQTLYIETY